MKTKSKYIFESNTHPLNYVITNPGKYVLFEKNLMKITDNLSLPRMLIFTDIDQTLVNESQKGIDALTKFSKYWLKTCYTRTESPLQIVYSTGRNFESVERLFNRITVALWPKYVISSVGSIISVYNGDTQKYEIDQNWDQIMKQN